MATPDRRITPSIIRQPAVTVTRASIKADELVYVMVADKKLPYPDGRSRIAYIGMTESGVNRITASAAYRSTTILAEPGVHSFSVHVVKFPPLDGRSARHWKKRPALMLERAMLISFKEKYGAVPLCNDKGSNMTPIFDEYESFARERISRLLDDLS